MTMFGRSPWWVPVVSVALGVIAMAALWVGGEPRAGVSSLAVMTALGLALLLGGRSETVRALRGDGRDEYWDRIDLRATAFAGMSLIALVLAMCAWEWAHGRSGTPYTQLATVAGLTYVGALAVVRWRS